MSFFGKWIILSIRMKGDRESLPLTFLMLCVEKQVCHIQYKSVLKSKKPTQNCAAVDSGRWRDFNGLFRMHILAFILKERRRKNNWTIYYYFSKNMLCRLNSINEKRAVTLNSVVPVSLKTDDVDGELIRFNEKWASEQEVTWNEQISAEM